MPGIAESVHLPEVAGYISVSRQRPAQRTIGSGNPTAQGKQAGTHFLGKQLVQNVPLVLRKAVQVRQCVHRFAADRDMQNVLRDRLRVGFVLGRFRSGGYFLHLGTYFVHCPKGVLNQLLFAFVYDDHIAVVVQVVLYSKDGQHFGPVARPSVTVLVVVFHRGFAAFRVRRHNVVDCRAEVGISFRNDSGNADAVRVTGFIGKQNAHR